LAWLLFAVGGGVLLVVDAQVHRLPARVLYPLAAAETAALTAAAATGGDTSRLLRAGLAAAVIGAGWLLMVFLAPTAMGMGDVRLLALTAGLLGWISCPAVLAGQLLAFVLAAMSTPVFAAVHRTPSWRGLQMPMGPAIVVAAVLTSCLI
jgi:leader peptidase (prepilin peptidase)/N-methyltransferase